jgi:hypothetical protein
MSSTRDKNVATNYSKVKEGNPMATVLSMQCGAVDRAAPITEFSQFPGEEEWLWTPMCYVEPEPEWQQLIDVTPHGVVRVIPVCVCVSVCVCECVCVSVSVSVFCRRARARTHTHTHKHTHTHTHTHRYE